MRCTRLILLFLVASPVRHEEACKTLWRRGKAAGRHTVETETAHNGQDGASESVDSGHTKDSESHLRPAVPTETHSEEDQDSHASTGSDPVAIEIADASNSEGIIPQHADNHVKSENGEDTTYGAKETLSRTGEACPAYFLRKKHDDASPFQSEVFVTNARCIVKIQYSDRTFKYYDANELKIDWNSPSRSSLEGKDIINGPDMIANAGYQLGQLNGRNDVAIVPLTRAIPVLYSTETLQEPIIQYNSAWIEEKLLELFPGYQSVVSPEI